MEYNSGNGSSQLAPTKVKYSVAGDATTTAADHMMDQFQYMLDLLQWQPMPLAGEFAEGQELRPKAIVCTREAKRLFARTNRAHGELFATISPVGNPSQGPTMQYGAIPLLTSDTLRDAALYPDITTGAAGVAGASGNAPVTERDPNGEAVGGYFYFLDPRTTNVWFHANRGWEQDEWEDMRPINKDRMYRLGRFLGNLHTEQFVTNGILYPSQDITNYTA